MDDLEKKFREAADLWRERAERLEKLKMPNEAAKSRKRAMRCERAALQEAIRQEYLARVRAKEKAGK